MEDDGTDKDGSEIEEQDDDEEIMEVDPKKQNRKRVLKSKKSLAERTKEQCKWSDMSKSKGSRTKVFPHINPDTKVYRIPGTGSIMSNNVEFVQSNTILPSGSGNESKNTLSQLE